MDNLRKWGKEVPLALKAAALQLAAHAWTLSKLLGHVKENKRFEAFGPVVGTQEWLGLYRNHKRVTEVMEKKLGQLNERWAESVRLFQSLKQLPKQLTGQNRERLRKELSALVPQKGNGESEKIHGMLSGIYESQLIQLEQLLQRKIDEDMGEKLMSMYKTPEGEFCARIWLVCVMYYMAEPIKILRKAGWPDGADYLCPFYPLAVVLHLLLFSPSPLIKGSFSSLRYTRA